MFAAEPGLLVSAERHGRIDGVMTVSPDRARLDRPRQRMHCTDVAGPDRRRQPVARGVRALHHGVEIIEARQANHWPEDLLTHHARLGGQVEDKSGRYIITLIGKLIAS